jgi:glycosyltransferase involved in cell wall biosynthesis
MGEAAGIPRSKMQLVHNGLPDLPATFRADPGAGSPRAVMVARFAAPKDHLTVVRAMQHVTGLELDFVGDGPDEETAKALAAELGVTDKIHFLGIRTDVPEILAKSHVFILSSHSEAFPISTLEAMRAGLPTVVANVGGAGEAVIDGKTGFLFERADHLGLADRLNQLAADPGLRARQGAEARAHFEREFTLDQMYTRTRAVYESVLRPARATAAVMGAQ